MLNEMPVMTTKTIDQSRLTGACWAVQIRGLSACEDCEFRDTDECGGQEIRAALLGGGHSGPVGVDGLPDTGPPED